MSKQDEIVKGLEQRLLGIQKKIDLEKAKGWLCRKTVIAELTQEYQSVHRRWQAARDQTALDV